MFGKEEYSYHYMNFVECKTNKDIKQLKKQLFKEHYKSSKSQNKPLANSNVRSFILSTKKHFMVFDTDDKESNDHVVSIMNKYGIKGNFYKSISNYFRPDLEENSHKFHYWFRTDKPITTHIHVNGSNLDIWGPRGDLTTTQWGNEDNRVICEPNVKGEYFDDSREYPLLTDSIYNDVVNIKNTHGLFSNKQKVTCILHDDCIGVENMEIYNLKKYDLDGYYPMSAYGKKFLNKHKDKTPMVIQDKSIGTICCVNIPGSNDPLIATLITHEDGLYFLPKGHPKINESNIDTALRETCEEIGIDVRKYLYPDVHTCEKYIHVGIMHIDAWKMHKDYPNESKRPICVYHKEVQFFLAVLPETMPLIPEREKNTECKWISLSKFKKMTYPSTQTMITTFFNSKNAKSKLACKIKNRTDTDNKKLLLQEISKKNIFSLFSKKKMISNSSEQKIQQQQQLPSNLEPEQKNKKGGLFNFFTKK